MTYGQTKMTREDYIEAYKDLAIKEMLHSGVPASITLAQGMLESDNGNSTLAVKANNHFGIKCHSDWNGKRIHHDDDEKGECFRKYKSVYESYEDHSDFLRSGGRYAFLFELDRTDYIGWAKGLKKAGYATSKNYAEMLIKIIDDNNLHQFDLMDEVSTGKKPARLRKNRLKPEGREILNNNRVDYIIVKEGETKEGLTSELNLMKNEILKYNELTIDSILIPGQIIYIQPKRNKANAVYAEHILQEGESMYQISQKYAVKLDKLLERNGLTTYDKPEPGTRIYLRKRKPGVEKFKSEFIPEDEEKLQFEFEE